MYIPRYGNSYIKMGGGGYIYGAPGGIYGGGGVYGAPGGCFMQNMGL